MSPPRLYIYHGLWPFRSHHRLGAIWHPRWESANPKPGALRPARHFCLVFRRIDCDVGRGAYITGIRLSPGDNPGDAHTHAQSAPLRGARSQPFPSVHTFWSSTCTGLSTYMDPYDVSAIPLLATQPRCSVISKATFGMMGSPSDVTC